MGAEQWQALSWDLQETYLQGMNDDPEVAFTIEHGTAPPEEAGAQVRTAEVAAEVISITSMISELDANPVARRRL